MAYDLHITRARDWWADDRDSEISLAEWLAYVASDSEMRLDNVAEIDFGSRMWRYEAPGLSVWLAHSGDGVEDHLPLFDHQRGNIVVKNPDSETCKKMCSIAVTLGAKVQGDDGERYEHGKRSSPAPR